MRFDVLNMFCLSAQNLSQMLEEYFLLVEGNKGTMPAKIEETQKVMIFLGVHTIHRQCS